MHRTLRAAMVAAVLVGASQPAAAQSSLLETPWEDRVFGGFNFAFDASKSDITTNSPFVIYDETGGLTTNAEFKADTLLDGSFGVRVWRNLGVAVGFSSRSGTGEGSIEGSIPHPVFYDQPRAYADSLDGIDRTESATHLQFGWMLPVNDRFDVFVHVGPSFYRLTQEVVSDLAIAEQGPPYSSVVVSPTFAVRKESAVGYNLGADATYIFYTNDQVRLGIGGFMRFTGATADVELGNGVTVESGMGGFQAGVGARVRF
jgi:hypothetical protein